MSRTPPPSASDASSRRRAGSGRQTTAPIGIKLICVLGWLASIVALLSTTALIGRGGGAAFVGLVLFVLTLAQIYVLYGLWTLREWAWTWTIVIYALGLLGDAVAANPFGLLVGLVLIAYVYSKRDLYRASRR